MEKVRFYVKEFLIFGLKQARACVFAGSFFIVLALSNVIPLGDFPRYDFLFLAAVAIQLILVLLKLETKDEVKVIALFHVIGVGLELFKTHPAIGSWSYPEPAFFKLGTVPLYSGFMYAAVGSYISQSWKIMKLRLEHYPPYKLSIPLVILIYVNFFTHHILPDFRWLLAGAVLGVFFKTTAAFTVTTKEYKMPLWLSFILIGFFIWVAENIATFFGAWQYPDQTAVWHIVSFGKISSWFMLVIISVIIVADLKHFKASLKKS
jgi:uncharacterized membrane protein YoaT (DUF817 family)